MMAEPVAGTAMPQTGGQPFRWALAYDLLLGILWRGAERTYREKTAQIAGVRTGESVLDVGCGTGTLAVALKGHVGATGKVFAVDPSRQMIARARKKAAAARADIAFQRAAAQALPFGNAVFDAVVAATVLHCLPAPDRRACIIEMIRVAKPGGRLLLIDYGGPAEARHSLLAHLRHHRNFDLTEIIPVLREAGLVEIEAGAFGFGDLYFVKGIAPG